MEQDLDYKNKKFKDDKIFQVINKRFISLKDEVVKCNNEKLHGV